MWHAVTPVSSAHDPALYEGTEVKDVVVLNAGPGLVSARAWATVDTFHKEPKFQLELRPGDQRIISGCLVRARLIASEFAAVAWQVLPKASP